MSVRLLPTADRESQTDFRKAISGARRKALQRKFQDFCELSTLHGLRDCYAAKNPIAKLFWVTVFCGALICAVYGLTEIILQYQKSPVVISYIVRREDESTKQLPDVIICPFSRFNSSFFYQHGIDAELVEHIQMPFFFNPPYKFFWALKDKSRLRHNLTNSNATKKQTTSKPKRDLDAELDNILLQLGNISYEHLLKLASFNCEDVIDYCVDPQKGVRNCCENATVVMTPQSKCYRLEGRKQESSGFSYGMTVVIKAPNESTVAGGRTLLHNNGVSVKIAEPKKGLDSDLTFIPTGVHALMPLKATRYEFMNDIPRYECDMNVAPNYSYGDCFDHCFFEKATQLCNCSSLLDTTARNYTVCSPKQLRHCFIPHVHNSKSLTHCKLRCKQPCHYWTYQPTVSYAKFPARSFYHYIDANADWSSYIVLNIFYEKLEYTVIKHYESMPYVTLIANLGGQVGLWVGGSILSMAQVVCFLVGLLKLIWRGGKLRHSSTNGTCQSQTAVKHSATRETWVRDFQADDIWHRRATSFALAKCYAEGYNNSRIHNGNDLQMRRTHSCHISCV